MGGLRGAIVKLLLDTHVWMWSQEAPEELGEKTRAVLLRESSEVLVSAVSALEIARMVAIGKVILAKELREWIREGLRSLGANSLVVDHEVAAESYRIPQPFHRDPADRMLVASARLHDCVLLSADRLILDYPHVRSMDARQ